MITTEGIIQLLKESRQEKLAATLVLGLMYDSIQESVDRLESILPTMKKIEHGSRKRYGRDKSERINVDHDIALLAKDIVEDLLPWLKKIAALQTEDEIGEEVVGLS